MQKEKGEEERGTKSCPVLGKYVELLFGSQIVRLVWLSLLPLQMTRGYIATRVTYLLTQSQGLRQEKCICMPISGGF